ncbi:MAG: HIT family protein [Candidatus Diapherotrites archaeon]|nr:HIT family protein [Candidatus Diapherotrites archaeon]
MGIIQKNDCIFCKFVTGEIKPAVVFKNESVLAILDINPAGALCGHTLVMPKKHFETIEDCPEKELKEAIAAVKKLVPAIKMVSGAEGINVIQNNGQAAGQLVNHVHFHIIPRARGDGIHFNENRRKPRPMELTEAAEAIKKALE